MNGEAGELETLSSGKVVAKKNGYVYVFTSNESQQDVLPACRSGSAGGFDNFGVMQISGPVLEETHYYPFGLTMAKISTTAPLKLANNYKYNSIELNNQEFSDGSGLDLYTAYYRSLDPQIGRWGQIDPRPTGMFSPYAAMGNNPVLYIDFLGDSTVPVENVKGNWSNFDTQNNTVGLNEFTVAAFRGYGNYDPFYTGASLDPLGVKWINSDMKGGAVLQTQGRSYFNLNSFSPSENNSYSPGLVLDATTQGLTIANDLGNTGDATELTQKMMAAQKLNKLLLGNLVLTSKDIAYAGKFLGRIGTAGGLLSILINEYKYSNGQITGTQFLTSSSSTATSIAVSRFLGPEAGLYTEFGKSMYNSVMNRVREDPKRAINDYQIILSRY